MSSLKKILPFAAILLILIALVFALSREGRSLPKVIIANYGPHASLFETIQGIKDELARRGFKEGEQISFEVLDVNFNQVLIPQMLSKVASSRPQVVVTLTTPVTLAAKNIIKNIPIVFTAITDPNVLELDTQNPIMTGVSDRQDLKLFLTFAKELLPEAKRIGLLYATGESNDASLVQMMQLAAREMGMEVVLASIDEPRDIPLRMQKFQGKVDFIYVGVSGPVQPSLPAIVAVAENFHIPVFNANEDAVKQGLVLGSYSVSYHKIGEETAKMVIQILNGESVAHLPIEYPTRAEHRAFINKKIAQKFGIAIPENFAALTVVE